MKILISIFFTVLLAGCMSAEKKAMVNKVNTSLLPGHEVALKNGETFTIRAQNFSNLNHALLATERKAMKLCEQSNKYWNARQVPDGFFTSDKEKNGYISYRCYTPPNFFKSKEQKDYENQKDQIILIDKAKELCTNYARASALTADWRARRGQILHPL